MKRLSIMIILLCMFALPVTANHFPDPDQKGSICVSMRYNSEIVPGGEVTLYHVADISEKNGDYSFALTGAFESAGISMKSIQSPETAAKLSDFAKQRKLSGATKKVNSNGEVCFDNLQTGLYLMTQDKAAKGYYRITPFLISLPIQESENYIYQVDASPKVSPLPKPENTQTPQTGQSLWPVWMFALSAAALVALHLMKKRVQ